jgi:hypothetical protein
LALVVLLAQTDQIPYLVQLLQLAAAQLNQQVVRVAGATVTEQVLVQEQRVKEIMAALALQTVLTRQAVEVELVLLVNLDMLVGLIATQVTAVMVYQVQLLERL